MSYNIQVEDQAVLNLLFLDESEPFGYIPKQNDNRQSRLLSFDSNDSKRKALKMRNHKHNLHNKKSKTQTEVNSLQASDKTSNKNKQNLKKILQKLQNSPSPKRKGITKVKNLTQHNVKIMKSKLQYQKKSNEHKITSLQKYLKKDDEFSKSLVKAKILERLRNLGNNKVQIISEYEKEKKHTTQRNLRAGTLRRNNATKIELGKEKISFTRLIKEQERMNGFILSRKNSQIRIKNLLF